MTPTTLKEKEIVVIRICSLNEYHGKTSNERYIGNDEIHAKKQHNLEVNDII